MPLRDILLVITRENPERGEEQQGMLPNRFMQGPDNRSPIKDPDGKKAFMSLEEITVKFSAWVRTLVEGTSNMPIQYMQEKHQHKVTGEEEKKLLSR